MGPGRRGRYAVHPLEIPTGHAVRRHGCETLRAAFADRRLVVGGVGGKVDRTGVPGTYFLHPYGVIDYDPAASTPKGPEGLAHGYRTEHGVFRVPRNEAVIWFGSFSVGTDEPVAEHHR